MSLGAIPPGPGEAALELFALFLASALAGPVGGLLLLWGAVTGGIWGLTSIALGSVIWASLASAFVSLKRVLKKGSEAYLRGLE